MKPERYVVKLLCAALALASSISAQQHATTPKPPAAAPIYVPLPEDIQCSFQELSFTKATGTAASPVYPDGTLKALSCWLVGKPPEQRHEIPLASQRITHGVFLTTGFGSIRVTPASGQTSAGPNIAIRRESLAAFRAYLARTDSPDAAVRNAHQDLEAAKPLPAPRLRVKYSETKLATFREKGEGGFSPYWVAYILWPEKDSTDKSVYVELNGNKLGPYAGVSSYVRVSPDQQHIAFAAKKGDLWTLVIDGIEKYSTKNLYWSSFSWGPALRGNVFSNEVNAAVFVFLPGNRFAYFAGGEDGKDHAYVNGKPGPGFPGFSTQMSWVGDALLTTAFTDKKPTMVHGAKQFGPYDSVSYDKISDDGLHYAVRLSAGETTKLLYDDKIIEPKGPMIDFAIGPHGELAYMYKSDAGIKVVFKDEEYPGAYAEVRFLTISPDGTKLAFWAKNGSQWLVMAGNKALPGGSGYFVYYAGDVYSLMWSHDSEHLVYYTRNNSGGTHSATTVLDGNPLRNSYAPSGMMVMSVIQDHDGSICGQQMMGSAHFDTEAVVEAALHEGNTACVAKSAVMVGGKLACVVQPQTESVSKDKAAGPARVVFGDKEEGPYKNVHSALAATKDGQHYAYVIETDQGWQVVADGILRPAVFEEVFRVYVNEDVKSFEYLALKGGNLYHVVQPFAAD